jgi:hypothetical protein
MYKTVAAVIDQHDSVWNKMAPFVTAVQQFEEKIRAIDGAAQKQETPVSGAVDDKGAARDALEDVCFLICEALGVLAHTSKDHDLQALVDLTPSQLDRLGDEELSNRATTILARANAMKLSWPLCRSQTRTSRSSLRHCRLSRRGKKNHARR